MYKVLLVDDEPFFRKGLIMSIEWADYGFEVCGEADNGEDAIEMINLHSPNLVITDIKMPAVDGIKLIEHVSGSMEEKPKFIVLSGYGEFSYAQTAIKYNVNNYILKPVNIDELAEALQSIRVELNNDERKKKERLKSIEIIAENTIRKLVKGEVTKDAVDFMQQWLHIGEKSRLVCMIVELDNFDKILNELDEREIVNKTEEFRNIVLNSIEHSNSLNIYEEDVFRYCILVSSQIISRYSNDVKNLVQAIKKASSKKGEIKVSIFVGQEVTGLSQIKKSYDTAVKARNYRFFISGSCIVYYDEIDDNFIYNYDLPDGIPFAQLISSIDMCNTQGIVENAEKIIKIFRENIIAPDLIRVCISNLFLGVLNHMSQECKSFQDQIDLRKLLYINKGDMTLEEAIHELTDLCLRCIDFVQSQVDTNNQSALKVMEYVNKNYKDGIYLKEVAYNFKMNPVYLGQLFKKEFGLYFNDYLNQLRIAESKKLLLNTNMKISEISKAIGYTSKEYFIKKFEKATSMTPMQYRRLNGWNNSKTSIKFTNE